MSNNRRLVRWGATPTGPAWNRYRLRLIQIPDTPEFVRAVTGVLSLLTAEEYWYDDTGRALDNARASIDMLRGYVMSDIVGTIVPYLTTQPPRHCLPLDGSTYARSQYPVLYDKLDPVYKTTTDFTLPDLTGRMMVGADSVNGLGVTGGTRDVTLTTAQIPAHTHIADPHSHLSPPHTHGESIAVPQPIAGGLEAPQLAATANVGVTGPTSVIIDPSTITIQSAGGGNSHTNMPPYATVKYAIVAI